MPPDRRASPGRPGEIGLPLLDASWSATSAVGDGAGDGAAAVRPGAAKAGTRSPTGAATSSTAARLAALFDGADVAVHLAFAIFGGREETRRVNLEGTPQRLRSRGRGRGRAARLRLLGRRLRLPPRQPAAADRGGAGARQRGLLLLGPEGRAGGGARRDRSPAARSTPTSFRPCIVAGPRATMLIEQIGRRASASAIRCRALRRGLERLPLLRPILPDPGVPIQLVHHDDVARALPPRSPAQGPPGAYNLAGDGEIGDRRHRPRARLALGPGSRPGARPRRRRSPGRLSFASPAARVGDRPRAPRC